MKRIKPPVAPLMLALCLPAVWPARAATITWTNTAGGNWSAAANWNPNQLPGASDTALITQSGTYPVTLDISTTVGSLTLGAGSGQQTFNTSNNSLTLIGAGLIGTNGVFNLNGGFVGGGTLAVNGQINWTAGQLGQTSSSIMVASNGLLVLAGVNGTDYSLGEYLTNAGTVRLQSGNLQINWLYYGELINLPGALVDVKADISMDALDAGPGFINQGTLRKSGGTGITAINPPFSNSGTVDAQTGTISFPVGGTDTGVLQSEASGSLLFSGGTFTLNGSLTSTNAVLGGGTLGGSGTISGWLTWTNGAFGAAEIGMTLATNGVLILAGATNGANYSLGQFLTNAGTIKLESGNLQINWVNWGVLVNLPGALVDVKADISMDALGSTGPGVINQGTLRKSGGTGTTAINPPLSNSGLLDVQTGTVSLAGQGSGTGNYLAEAGATLLFTNGYQVAAGGALSGAGTALLQGGLFTLNGNLAISNAVLAGGTLAGTGTISGVLTWTNGVLGTTEIGMTVAANGVLVLAGASNGADYSLGQFLTNAGTIQLQSGNLLLNWQNWGELINLPGGLVNVKGDVSIDATPNLGPGFINQGILRKSGGTGATAINSLLSNSGLVDVQTGTVNINGTFNSAGGTLNFGINSLSSFGQIKLTNSPAVSLSGSVSANFNNGFAPVAGNSFAVLTYVSQTGVFTNVNLPGQIAWKTNYGPTVFSLGVQLSLAPISPQTVNELATLSVPAGATDVNLPSATLTFGLVTAPAGMTINPSTGVITWIPAQTQAPSTNTVTVSVADNGSPALRATNSFTVIVFAPTLAPIANTTVNVGQTLSFTALATDNDPTRTLTYSLASAPTGATIGPGSGAYSWRPGVAFANTTNNIVVEVSDNSIPVLSATQSFNVVVNALTPVMLGPLARSASQVQIQISGPQGPDYILQASTTLAAASWSNLFTNTPASLPFTLSNTNVATFPQRFYRIQLGP